MSQISPSNLQPTAKANSIAMTRRRRPSIVSETELILMYNMQIINIVSVVENSTATYNSSENFRHVRA